MTYKTSSLLCYILLGAILTSCNKTDTTATNADAAKIEVVTIAQESAPQSQALKESEREANIAIIEKNAADVKEHIKEGHVAPKSDTAKPQKQPEDDGESRLNKAYGDPVAGNKKSLLCQGCHGETGVSTEPMIPKLSGQYENYIEKQIRNFQAGTRSNQIMNAMAATIRDEDLADIAAYFASQPKMKGNGKGNPLGERIFLNGNSFISVIACFKCHGVNGKGPTPKYSRFPVIGGQNKDYLRKQIMDFRDGIRTNSPGGIMRKITLRLTDEEIEALADYISVL